MTDFHRVLCSRLSIMHTYILYYMYVHMHILIHSYTHALMHSYTHTLVHSTLCVPTVRSHSRAADTTRKRDWPTVRETTRP